jgi:hypothetical protein
MTTQHHCPGSKRRLGRAALARGFGNPIMIMGGWGGRILLRRSDRMLPPCLPRRAWVGCLGTPPTLTKRVLFH